LLVTLAAPAFGAGVAPDWASSADAAQPSEHWFSLQVGGGYTHVFESSTMLGYGASRQYGEADLRLGVRWALGRIRFGVDALLRPWVDNSGGFPGLSGAVDVALFNRLKEANPYFGVTGELLLTSLDGRPPPLGLVGPEVGIEIRDPAPDAGALANPIVNVRVGAPMAFYNHVMNPSLRLLASIGLVF
jgi:hypothetical protein